MNVGLAHKLQKVLSLHSLPTHSFLLLPHGVTILGIKFLQVALDRTFDSPPSLRFFIPLWQPYPIKDASPSLHCSSFLQYTFFPLCFHLFLLFKINTLGVLCFVHLYSQLPLQVLSLFKTLIQSSAFDVS